MELTGSGHAVVLDIDLCFERIWRPAKKPQLSQAQKRKMRKGTTDRVLVAYILKICVRYGNVNVLAALRVLIALNDAALLNNQPEDAKLSRALKAAAGW